jgi:hypothetical protein
MSRRAWFRGFTCTQIQHSWWGLAKNGRTGSRYAYVFIVHLCSRRTNESPSCQSVGWACYRKVWGRTDEHMFVIMKELLFGSPSMNWAARVDNLPLNAAWPIVSVCVQW